MGVSLPSHSELLHSTGWLGVAKSMDRQKATPHSWALHLILMNFLIRVLSITETPKTRVGTTLRLTLS